MKHANRALTVLIFIGINAVNGGADDNGAFGNHFRFGGCLEKIVQTLSQSHGLFRHNYPLFASSRAISR